MQLEIITMYKFCIYDVNIMCNNILHVTHNINVRKAKLPCP